MSKIKEFQDFIAQRRPKTYVFCSDNQPSFRAADTCRLELTFTNMLINENPGVIYLTGGGSSMRLAGVKKVEFFDNITPLGTLIRVHCRCVGQDPAELCYNLIAN